jgi:hypothetical protein
MKYKQEERQIRNFKKCKYKKKYENGEICRLKYDNVKKHKNVEEKRDSKTKKPQCSYNF